jgi:DNA uptake protein ComE-like DNA-binding protein
VDPTNQLDWPNDKLGNKLPLAALVTIHSGAPDTQASGAARINFDTTRVTATQLRQLGLNRFTASQIAGHAFTSYSSLFAVRGMNLTYAGELLNVATFSTTTTTTGKFNINTASAAALETIPSMTSDVANAIVQQQTSGYETLGAVANLAGFTTRSLGAIADSLTIGSNTWIVRAYGQNGSASTAIEAVVGMRSNQIQVISCNRLHTVQIPSWWDWDQQTTSNVQAGTTTQ